MGDHHWRAGVRPKGGARELPFPIAAECAGGAQRVKVEHPPGRQAHPPCLTLTREAQTATIARQGKGTSNPTTHLAPPPTPRPCTATGPGPDPSTAAQANHSHAGLIGLNSGLPGYSYALSLGGSAPEGDYFS